MAGHDDQAAPEGCLPKISHAIESRMNSFFSKLGYLVAMYPLRTILLAVLGSIIGMSGFSVLDEESRGDKLWVPTGTRAVADYGKYQAFFPRQGRSNYVIMAPSDGGNVLTQEYLTSALELFQDVSAITITYEGTEYSFEEICVSSVEFTGTPCLVESVLGTWDYETSTLTADTTIIDTINNASTVDELENFLGGMTLSDDGTEVVSAEALWLQFYLENTETVVNGEYVDPIPEAWELEFIDVAQDCMDGLDCYVEASRSLSDEFGEAISGDISLISGSYMIILLYAIINLSGRPLLKSRILLSLGALVTVGLCIGFSIGLASYLGFFYTPLHTLVPFVLLGLGVDDSFVICNAFGRTDPRKSIPERMREGLGTSGVSITVTSITDVVAFVISATTNLPALSSFCVYAALGVLGLYILQSTLFVAFVVLDARRQEAGRLDCVPCCCKTKDMDLRPSAMAAAAAPPGVEWDPSLGPQGRLDKFVANTYAPILTKVPVKVFVLTIFAAILGVCAYGATQLDVSDTGEAFIPDGSYLLATTDAVDEYFGGVGESVDVVTTCGDFFAQQAVLADVPTQLSGKETSSPYIQDPRTSGTFFSWFDDLIKYAEAEGTATLVTTDGVTVFSDSGEFYTTLGAFLRTDAGGGYNSSVVMSADGSSIMATAMQAEYSGSINGNADQQVDAMVDLRSIVDGFECEAFPWSDSYLDWETFRVIYQELYQGLGLCLLAVFVLTLILIAHPFTAILVFFCVTFTIVDVLGIMYYWGLSIDTVAVINLVLAVGLSVDYAAHVGHSFMLKAGTRDERVVQTLGDIGVAVIHGGVSTFLAVVLLSLSSSYVFRVLFKQFFSTAVMGLAHGLILLPVMLSLVGPNSYASASKGPKNGESTVTPMAPETTRTSSKVADSGGLA